MSWMGRGRELARGRISAGGDNWLLINLYNNKQAFKRRLGQRRCEPEVGRRSSRIVEGAEGGAGRGNLSNLALNGK